MNAIVATDLFDPPNWIKSGWGYKAGTPDDLMRAIGRIGTLQVGRRFVWRGVSDWRWRVQSSLLRALVAENGGRGLTEAMVRSREVALIYAARQWGIGRELIAAASDQQILATLQHHGAPTRLLDVTSNPMTALWFACQKPSGKGPDASGALMAFDVTELETLATATHDLSPTYGSIAEPGAWHLENALVDSVANNRSFLVKPSYPDQRMVAQEGLFLTGAVPLARTVPGVDGLPLQGVDPPGPKALETLFAATARKRGRPKRLSFVVLVIPAAVKSRMRPHLEGTYNRSYRQLFPDIAGFVDALKAHKVDLVELGDQSGPVVK